MPTQGHTAGGRRISGSSVPGAQSREVDVAGMGGGGTRGEEVGHLQLVLPYGRG